MPKPVSEAQHLEIQKLRELLLPRTDVFLGIDFEAIEMLFVAALRDIRFPGEE